MLPRARSLPFNLLLTLLGVFGALPGVRGDEAQPTAAQLEFFETRIRPVLANQCYECHSSQSKKVKGSLLLDTRTGIRRGGDSGPSVVPGKPADSVLLDALKYDGLEMPPKGKLGKQVIADFEQWIRSGAADPRAGDAVVKRPKIDFQKAASFWAFQPPQQPPLPKVDSPWIKNDIDRYVFSRLESHGLTPSSPAERRVLIRRAYLDLVGLPPTMEEVSTFLADNDPRAFETVINTLLGSPAYGERWGRHWLDVARYGEDQAHTFKARKYPRGYFYRDWVVNALNADLPYNEFLFHQLAADLAPGDSQHEHLAALGFFALGPVYYAENVEKAKAIADEWDDRIDTLTRGVLGLTVSCARCHDHKYDPITMEDYYGLAGIFASTQYQERPIASPANVKLKQDADRATKDHKLIIDRFLQAQARQIRPSLANQVPTYFQATWQFINKRTKQKDQKKLSAQLAKDHKVSATLLRRWVALLASTRKSQRDRYPALTDWYAFLDTRDLASDLSGDANATATVAKLAEEFQRELQPLLSRRVEFVKRYGDNFDFIKASETARVKPGVIPLGNLFDDSKAAPLAAAVASDRFGAAAAADRLGILKLAQGWGTSVSIAPDITFDFRHLGSDTNKHGTIANDSWGAGGLRTRGKPLSPSAGRLEQGVGMHANALVTFDLAEIRRAGLLPEDQPFRFKVDRAGINDDVSGVPEASAFMSVIVSRPHRKKEELDALLSIHVNGQPVETGSDDFTYYISSPLPPAVKADGQFHAYDLAIPGEARYLTLVTTGASAPDNNPISCDHTVFSGARLEQDPLPAVSQAAATKNDQPSSSAVELAAARLLSRMFYDEGLLALPVAEITPHLPGESAQQLKDLQSTHASLQKKASAIAIPMAHALRDDKPRDIKIYLQGDPAKQSHVAPRAMPAIFTGGTKSVFKSNGSGRLELARALTATDNPLTARVMVNRVWAAHFGRGLVRTTSNFGELGSRPSHPQLLDHLATRFVANDWSLKQLHRDIMLSATYQQTSTYREDQAKVDGDNQWLWRMNRRRLEIESWRDSMLFVSGELDETVGGPSLQLSNQKNRRRTLYGFVSRHRLDELLRLFDFPDPNITSASRVVTTVPLQQLFVLNSEFMAQRARALAGRIEKEASQDEDGRIEHAFQLLYQRPPSESDLELARGFLQAAAAEKGNLTPWQQYAMVLLAANEFMYVD